MYVYVFGKRTTFLFVFFYKKKKKREFVGVRLLKVSKHIGALYC